MNKLLSIVIILFSSVIVTAAVHPSLFWADETCYTLMTKVNGLYYIDCPEEGCDPDQEPADLCDIGTTYNGFDYIHTCICSNSLQSASCNGQLVDDDNDWLNGSWGFQCQTGSTCPGSQSCTRAEGVGATPVKACECKEVS